METFSASLVFVRESTGRPWIPSQRPVTRNFDIFFDLCLNKRLSQHSERRRFEAPSSSFWRHPNDSFQSSIMMVMLQPHAKLSNVNVPL